MSVETKRNSRIVTGDRESMTNSTYHRRGFNDAYISLLPAHAIASFPRIRREGENNMIGDSGGGRSQEARTLYSETVVHRCYGKVIRLHGDIVFTRRTNCKLARAKLR